MAGLLTVDTIQSDSSYASTLNVASKMNFAAGMQIGGQDATFGGMRNRIINGNMVIDQRNAGASVTPASGAYTLDRWTTGFSQSSKVSIQQNAGSVTPPSGFTNYLGATVAATATVGSTDYFQIAQKIEANNTADLDWSLSTGKTVTLSFWARCSSVVTLGGSIQSVVSPYPSYPFTYSFTAANTWQQFVITIPAPTAGTNWNTTGTSASMFIQWNLACGSTYSGTANAWQNANVFGATGAGSIMGTVGNYLYITGVQLEKGSAASAFENRQYGTELALCQRYFEITGEISNSFLLQGYAASAGAQRHPIFYTTRKRTTPTVTVSGGGTTGWSYSNGSGLFVAAAGTDTTRMEFNAAAAGITFVYNNNGGYITSSAEL